MVLEPHEPPSFHLLVSREEWGARKAKKLPILNPPVPKVRHTNTNTPECTSESECLIAVRNLQRNHMYKGYNDIKYSFVIGGDGRAYEGRGWYYEPEIPKLNKVPTNMKPWEVLRPDKKEDKRVQSIDFAFIGEFFKENKPVLQEMIDVARGLVEWGIRHKLLSIPFDVEEYYDTAYGDVPF